ncbi:zinc finger-containing ubiquitin peptidase 1-like isoform X2 [Chrysoperla carnea]|uniref:zinc finger-containing ubiquitin peptidase 1-like isoform X2 n=1 Tax=Chrysoperla carnea TaxID=189513 RepID=UPI001D08A71C|nr:zinc finger-containing ubiquitin peptidase 1-like isoform X2 [Chrysoperla carnea]
MAASNIPDDQLSFTCEICGVENLSEDSMRTHTKEYHIDGHGSCPFCDLAAGNLEELTLHVNQVHLDYLTPENELLTFIDEDNTLSHDDTDDTHNWQLDDDYDDDNNKGAHGVAGATASHATHNGSTSCNNVNVGRGYGGGGEGSPYRSQLALKLKHNASEMLGGGSSDNKSPQLQCPLCPHRGENPARLEEHINRQHFDLTSPMLSGSTSSMATNGELASYPCPLCVRSFQAASDLELHVNIEHRDVLSPGCPQQSSPQQSSVAGATTPTTTSCPVCGTLLGASDVARHVEEHFPTANGSASGCDDSRRDAQRVREQHEFDLLRAQYGMDNQELRAAESYGVDDGSSITKHIVQKVRAILGPECLTCTYVDHYASSYGDRGWGCGYRNAQMLLSSLLTHTGYNDLLYRKLWTPQGELPPRTAVPSISRLQVLIEAAWAQGFDLQGSEQLGCRLHNTRKWIGATEVFTLLSSMRIKCQLIDFYRPTGADGTHPELFSWVLNYFQCGKEFLPPLYLQHQGHSRTIMGVECVRDGGTIQLLILDPSHSPQQMAQLNTNSTASQGIRLLRKGPSAMKARQYQLVVVVGTIDSEAQYQQSKVLRGIRIPQDR